MRGALASLAVLPWLAGCGTSQAPTPGAGNGTPSTALEAREARAREALSGYRVVRTDAREGWAFIERLENLDPDFPEENARPSGRQRDKAIVAAFGTERPSSRNVLLHAMDGWDRQGEVPVLLVHGAITDAQAAWMSPHGHEGLAPWLGRKGKPVFALTFAHRHGDNLLQAEQVRAALARIRALTGAARVDVVAHSKGVAVVRALLGGLHAKGLPAYSGGIRKVLMLGGPLGGIDYTWRHPSVQYGLVPELDDPLRNAPVAWERMLVFGLWKDTGAQSFMTDRGNFFPGQAQLLRRWDARYPLSPVEPDWYTTYYGGQGFVSFSRGIDAAIKAGGDFIERMESHPLPKGQDVAVLAGDRPTMTTVRNETDGPSDGVVFVESATHVERMVSGGADLVRKDVLHLNHMELIYADAARAWVEDTLARPEL